MNALRRAIARRTLDDDGFILPYVLLVTMLILVGTGTMLTVVMNNAVPAAHTQSQTAALAAAQSGIQTYVAGLNANCANYSIGECQWPFNATANAPRILSSGAPGAPALTNAAYTVTATNAQGYLNHNSDDLRVLSTGCVPNCTAATKTTSMLLADISGTPNALRFAYFTNYESIDGNLLSNMYPAGRTIQLNGPFATLAGATSTAVQAAGGSVTWSGAATAATCNQTWSGGRSTGTNDDAAETLTAKPAGVTGTFDHYCSVTFTKGMSFNGPVYSADQLLLSNGVPGASTGPSFSVPTACTAVVTTNCETFAPASSPASPAFRPVGSPPGGAPQTPGSVQTATFSVTLPTSATDASASCVYSGNTHITFVDPATSTSPRATVTGGTVVSGVGCGPTISAVSHKTLVVQGTAYVHGSLNASAGQVSVVALPGSGSKGDIVVDGSLNTAGAATTGTNKMVPNQYGENGFGSNSTAGAVDLVATNDVIMQHDVTCASGPSGTITDFGSCNNDISGLYTTTQSRAVVNDNGTLKAMHPARQYCNVVGNQACGTSSAGCDASTNSLTVDAAIFALNGSFRTANYNRGCALGTLNVVGGIYQNHRGPLGQEWETTTTSSSRAYSGYKLQLNYESLQSAGLPYVPALQGGSATHPWVVLAVSSPTNGSGS